jgi:EmrB/QacA subfamily drug resistance transporter
MGNSWHHRRMSTAFNSSCDRAYAYAVQRNETTSNVRFVLATTILASSLAYVDGSVVNVGLVAIGRSLAADASALQWVINAYLLPLSALLLLGGAAGDRFGRRRILMLGISIFALGSTACAVAPGFGILVAGRLLQGIGAAMLAPNSLAVLGQSFSGAAKGRAVGIWAATGAIAGAVGPVLGGWLIDLGSWRAIFLINLPLAAAAILLAWRYMPGDPEPTDPRTDNRRLDLTGGVLATVGLGALTFGLTLGSGASGWTGRAIGATFAGCALLLIFVLFEKGTAERAMMPLSLFGSRGFVALTLLTLFLYAALGELFVLLPFVLIRGAGYSAVAAGAALLPLPITLALASPFAGSLAERIGARWLLAVGPLVVAAGFVLALRIGVTAPYWTHVLPSVFVIALGLSAAVAPLTTAVLSAVDARYMGAASGINSAVAETGGLIATALLGAVLAGHGALLLAGFHVAMGAGALVCVAASLATLAMSR